MKLWKLDEPLSIEQIDTVLEFLPVLERLHSELYDNGFIVSFDWPSWQDEVKLYLESPELLNSADLNTIRKLITVHVRKERFCEGHFTTMVKIGHIGLLLERLKVIRNASTAQLSKYIRFSCTISIKSLSPVDFP